MIIMICRICGNESNNKIFFIKEMMFGFREEFPYIECSRCGCLQIEEIPQNISKYYPKDYYSFQSDKTRNSFLKSYFINELYKYVLFKKSLIGKILSTRYPVPILDCIRLAGVNFDSKILDVGCGAGHLLYSLRNAGFKNLLGVDPYIELGFSTKNLKIFRADIHELSESQKFDLIMFNHSFEHMSNPKEILFKVSNLLNKNGTCLISLPVKTKFVWDHFGVNWVQIDSPRHFFLYTPGGFKLLAEKTGMKVSNVIFNSREFLFWGSEQYLKDIPLRSKGSYSENKKDSIFSKKDIKRFRRMSEELNRKGQGDSAIFFLKIQI